MRHDNDYVQQMARAHEALNYERIGPKPEGYIAEGMFGQVKELAPGYVEKTTPPVVEWPPRGVDSDEAGYLYDARDFKREAEIQDKLSRTHIAPKVEAFNILDNGSTELITRDLRDNFDFGESRYTQLEDTISGNSTPQQKAQAMAAKGILDVKRKQQEAIAISNGLKLDDRHEGNVVVNKLTGNPLQIDFGMVRNVEGPAKDFQRADTVVAGFRNAGLTDEADIFDGLIREAMDANDSAMLKDLAQQGASRLMKIKKMPKNYKTVSELAPVARDPRMAGVYF